MIKAARIVCYIYWGIALASLTVIYLGKETQAKLLLDACLYVPVLAVVNIIQFAILLRKQRSVEVYLGIILGIFMLAVSALVVYINYRLANGHYGQ